MLKEIENSMQELNSITIENISELEKVKVKYLGKNGIVTDFLNKLKNADNEEKKELGKVINEFKNKINIILSSKSEELKNKELNKKLNYEKIDITLPGIKINSGKPHILEKLIKELEELFISLGFDVFEGPEVEKDLYNFEMLNLPKGHPARDAQDTFYITDEMLLRSQTSPVQIRSMLANKEKTQMRMICSGKTFRRDNDDATHSHQFTQMEGLVVDNEISLTDLKGILETVANKLFGNVESRFRPSFYPFTEPSVEFDISCFLCKGKGCPICKKTGWITVAGAGIVHPNVLNNCGYDSTKYTGYAFGFGLERLAMIKYGISDIRTFYINDLRVEDFDVREGEANEN